jgi:SAM-dependent methyltransferase
VLEVGCGDGRSFEHYPTSVTQLVAVEPDSSARAAAADRARATSVPIDVVDGTAETLPAEQRSFDAVVSMGVLCTVSDPAAALAEIRRVLAPTGRLYFWEHVRSRRAPLRLLQGTLDAVFWTRALGGCRTTRDTAATIATSGFELVSLDHGFHASSPLTITAAPYIIGSARLLEPPSAPDHADRKCHSTRRSTSTPAQIGTDSFLQPRTFTRCPSSFPASIATTTHSDSEPLSTCSGRPLAPRTIS